MLERPVSIVCATDKELIKGLQKTSYTDYWKDLIRAELALRDNKRTTS
jgi:hypothetical protein